jgi:uncharacterized protein YbaA (DUF1428 family)
MSKYVDGFVLVVPKDKTEEYTKMAEDGRKSWLKHGALEYFECIGEDLKPQSMGGNTTRSFKDMAGAQPDEQVWFSFIIFKSKEHRDEVNAKVMAEMDKSNVGQENMTMPFSMHRMAYGGFQALVETE